MNQTIHNAQLDAYMDAIELLRDALIKAEAAYSALPDRTRRWTYSPVEVAKGENPKAIPLRAPDNPAWPLAATEQDEMEEVAGRPLDFRRLARQKEFPSTPTDGDLCIRMDLKRLFVFRDGRWHLLELTATPATWTSIDSR
jgi:hypothetical protein